MRTRRLAPGGTSPRRIRPAAFTPVAVLLATLGYGPLIGQETGGRAFTFDDAIDLVRVSGREAKRLTEEGRITSKRGSWTRATCTTTTFPPGAPGS